MQLHGISSTYLSYLVVALVIEACHISSFGEPC